MQPPVQIGQSLPLSHLSTESIQLSISYKSATTPSTSARSPPAGAISSAAAPAEAVADAEEPVPEPVMGIAPDDEVEAAADEVMPVAVAEDEPELPVELPEAVAEAEARAEEP